MVTTYVCLLSSHIGRTKSAFKSQDFLCKHTLLHDSSHLEGSLISMCPHVNAEGGIVCKLLEADFAAEAWSAFGLGELSLEMGQHVLLQGAVGGKSAAAGPHWALERRLARVG